MFTLDMTHTSEHIAAHRPDPYRDGSRCRVRCSCGWRSAKHATYGEASADFIWHLDASAVMAMSNEMIGHLDERYYPQ